MYQGNVLRCAAVSAVATALCLAAASAWAQSPGSIAIRPLAPKCVVPPDQARFDLPLSRTALRLSGGLPIKIVAIGSSSTYGAGASSPTRSYPSRLEVELRRHFPGHPLSVVNRGVGGEEVSDMLARFQNG